MTVFSDIEGIYPRLDGCEAVEEYSRRHGIESLAVLTIFEEERAAQVAAWLCPKIHGKVVVEIGAGIGLLAMHMAAGCARRVYAIEAQPSWSWVYVQNLHAVKPPNCSFIFGRAEEFVGIFAADVAVICTQSGREAMHRVGRLLANEVVDVWSSLKEASEKGVRTGVGDL